LLDLLGQEAGERLHLGDGQAIIGNILSGGSPSSKNRRKPRSNTNKGADGAGEAAAPGEGDQDGRHSESE